MQEEKHNPEQSAELFFPKYFFEGICQFFFLLDLFDKSRNRFRIHESGSAKETDFNL